MLSSHSSKEAGEFLSAAAIADPSVALERLKSLRAGVPSVNIADDLGNTPLHEAKSAKVVRWLISEGAMVDAQNKQGMTALYQATSRGNSAIMHALLDCGASTDIKTSTGATALSIAWQYGWEQPKLMLIAFGADKKDAPPSLRRISPLMAAAQANLPKRLARLLADGAPTKGPSSPERLLKYAQNEFGRDSICAVLQAYMAKQTMAAIVAKTRAGLKP